MINVVVTLYMTVFFMHFGVDRVGLLSPKKEERKKE
jgi:hypothetical protein